MTRDDLRRLEAELLELHGEAAWEAAGAKPPDFLGPALPDRLVGESSADWYRRVCGRELSKMAKGDARLTSYEHLEVLRTHGSVEAWLANPSSSADDNPRRDSDLPGTVVPDSMPIEGGGEIAW